MFVLAAPAVTSAQGPQPTLATDVTAAEIQAVIKAAGSGDQEVKIVDMGRYNLGIAILRQNARKAGAVITGLNHTKVTEVYYIVSGSGTLVTGGEVGDVKPMAADNQLVTTVVGPSNNAVFRTPAQVRTVSAGDVVVIPAGVYHGWREIPDHVEYVSIRPDLDKVLPAGYVNPTLRK
jgi:mannose-6-phosphate isomerase-like protein (cupin superfamily)